MPPHPPAAPPTAAPSPRCLHLHRLTPSPTRHPIGRGTRGGGIHPPPTPPPRSPQIYIFLTHPLFFFSPHFSPPLEGVLLFPSWLGGSRASRQPQAAALSPASSALPAPLGPPGAASPALPVPAHLCHPTGTPPRPGGPPHRPGKGLTGVRLLATSWWHRLSLGRGRGMPGDTGIWGHGDMGCHHPTAPGCRMRQGESPPITTGHGTVGWHRVPRAVTFCSARG